MYANTHPNDFNRPNFDQKVVQVLSNRIGFGYIDQSLRVRTTSPLLDKLSDYDQSNIIGAKVSDVFVEFFGCDDDLFNIMKGDIPFLEIRDVNRIDNLSSYAYYDFTIMPLDGEKNGEGLILMIEEKTDEANLRQHLVQQRNELRLTQSQLTKANAQLHRLDHLKTLFLSIAAHDIQTPLSIITSYADMLFNDVAPEFTPEIVAKTIMEQSLWLQTLVDGLLDLRGIEDGEFPINIETIDVREPILFVSNHFRVPLEARGVEVITDIPDTPILIQGDASRLKQVAYNIIGNSAKFIGKSGTIHIGLSQNKDKNSVTISFADSGPGIEEKHLSRLFDLFYRTPRGARVKGTGLGLYIVKTIVDAHQGTVEVESTLGEGTRFLIKLSLSLD
ncbi:MAG: HAMP domain-containing sensor histidine kinase [Chloroflexota bacterium]